MQEVQEHDVCRVCSLDIPNQSTMYRVQAKAFTYGNSHIPALTHCYEAPSTKEHLMAHIFLANGPSFDDIRTGEKILVESARYNGVLTPSGLQEYSQLQRPIACYYSPPVVTIVQDTIGDVGNVRAILVDAAYFYTNTQHSQNTFSKDSVVEYMQRKDYTKADHAYKAFSMECMGQLQKRECPWRT
jgi:hypothetical protein